MLIITLYMILETALMVLLRPSKFNFFIGFQITASKVTMLGVISLQVLTIRTTFLAEILQLKVIAANPC